MIYLHNALDYSLLALGLGFVIFFHELGTSSRPSIAT